MARIVKTGSHADHKVTALGQNYLVAMNYYYECDQLVYNTKLLDNTYQYGINIRIRVYVHCIPCAKMLDARLLVNSL